MLPPAKYSQGGPSTFTPVMQLGSWDLRRFWKAPTRTQMNIVYVHFQIYKNTQKKAWENSHFLLIMSFLYIYGSAVLSKFMVPNNKSLDYSLILKNDNFICIKQYLTLFPTPLTLEAYLCSLSFFFFFFLYLKFISGSFSFFLSFFLTFFFFLSFFQRETRQI